MRRALRIAGIALQFLLPVSAMVDIGLVLAGVRIDRWEVLVYLGIILMLWALVMSERKTARIWRGVSETWRSIVMSRYDDPGP